MSRTILCVEDEEDTGDLIQMKLEHEGYLVVRAKDGRQARCLMETMRPPSLILLDLVLPYVSGFELLTTFRANPDWRDIPILMVSADSYEPDIQRLLSGGASEYVVKKSGLEDLLATVRRFFVSSDADKPRPPMPTQAKAEAKASTTRPRRASIRSLNRHANKSRKHRAA